LSVEDWAEIRRLHRAEELPIKLIARRLGVSRNTVRAALASDGPPKYERKPAGSAVDAFEDAIRAQLVAVPTMPATVIAERIGWTRGMTVFKERVRELRPAYLPPDPAGRTSYDAGDIAQCDLWFPPATVPVGYGQARMPLQLPVLTMVLGYSWKNRMADPSYSHSNVRTASVGAPGRGVVVMVMLSFQLDPPCAGRYIRGVTVRKRYGGLVVTADQSKILVRIALQSEVHRRRSGRALTCP
jgi:hypothetical protein